MKLNAALFVAFAMLFIPPLSFAENKIELVLKKDIKLSLIMVPFVKSKHKIKRCGKESVCLINRLPVFGADGAMPKTKLKSMVVTIKGRRISLDVSAMYEPWTVYKGANYAGSFTIRHSWGGIWILTGGFSDGAGGYKARWLISEGKSIRTILGGGESLAEFCTAFK
jgi:hypothetical protein